VNDHLVRVIAKSIGLRVFICSTRRLVNEARENHHTSPIATQVLGRALTGAALMGALLKVKQRVALKFEGNGPLKKAIVESNSYGRVRGYIANPGVNLPETAVVDAIGRAGLLTVVKDVNLPELVESVVPLQTSTIDGDLQSYLTQSEQIPSFVYTGVSLAPDGSVAAAGGMLLQAIPPNGDAETVAVFTDRAQELPPIVSLLLEGKEPHEILPLLLEDVDYDVLEKRELEFKCNCSRERSLQALSTLGKNELQHLYKTEKQAVVDCHFCHKQYVFDDLDLEILIEDLELAESDE
jgi:molecular chaperone Hsp33